MTNETFVPTPGTLPDYGLDTEWSGGTVPGLGTVAVIRDTTAWVDPGGTLAARIVLQGDAALAGNGGGFSLGDGSAVSVAGGGALYADGAIVDHGTIAVGAGAALTIAVGAGAAIARSFGLNVPSFENAGQVTVFGGATLAVEGTELSNTGAIVVAGGLLEINGGAVDGGQGNQPTGGEIVLEGGGTARFSDGIAHQRILFEGSGTLALDDATDLSGVTLRGFSTLDSIFVPSRAAGETALGKLTFTNLPDHTAPMVVADGATTEILLEPVPPCFARGACLLTPTGYRAVETLKPGDPLVTAGGDIRAVRWIGCRTIDIAAHRRPDAVRPICLTPGALSPGVPARPLRLSPDHALLLHGQLVPIKLLVNGATILREHGCLAVTYYHVELDRHDILLAENLAVESYIDTGNRAMFATTAGTPRRHPVFGRGKQWDAQAYAPLCLGGPILKQIRRELRARTGALGFTPRTLTDVTLWAGTARLPRLGGPDDRPDFAHDGTATRITIRSPRFVPADFASGGEDEPDHADERCLGIALAGLRLNDAPHPVGHFAIAGFHPRAGNDPAAWTDGNAEIELPPGVIAIGLDIAALPLGWRQQAATT